MQVSPSASLLQALSGMIQPAGARSPDGGAPAPAARTAAPGNPAGGALPEPAPGTPIRRGMLVDILA